MADTFRGVNAVLRKFCENLACCYFALIYGYFRLFFAELRYYSQHENACGFIVNRYCYLIN